MSPGSAYGFCTARTAVKQECLKLVLKLTSFQESDYKVLRVYIKVKLHEPLPRQPTLSARSDDVGGIQPCAVMMSRPGFPRLQLSVFVFLRIVVSSLGLVGQLSAVLGLVVLLSSGLRVRWPEWGLLLGIGA